MKKTPIITFIAFLLAFLYFLGFGDFGTMTGGTTTIETFVQDHGDLQVYFCPHQDCNGALNTFLQSAEKSIHCALFELDLPEIQQTLLQKQKDLDVKVITDNQYLYEFNHSFVKTDTWGLMHNKFCIVDNEKISTGSMNPTVNGAEKNNNNLLLINSEALATNYEAEFQEMWDGTFKKGQPIKNPSIKLNDIEIENYFCPEDDCGDQVKEEIEKAQSSIHFMTFSFTHESIANFILLKQAEGIPVYGIMEARQVSKYSQFNRLVNNGADVIKDNNKANMHHKVFIIDGETVITGSMNPSKNGDERSDENILIIHDKNTAELFLEEFNRLKEK